MIETVFHFDSTPIRVLHDQCSDPVGRSDDGLLIHSNHRDADTLSRITIGPYGDTPRVYVFWSIVSTVDQFDLLYIPSKQMLFLGGGTVSASVNLATMSIVHQNDVMLFWSFERRRDWILELGEV